MSFTPFEDLVDITEEVEARHAGITVDDTDTDLSSRHDESVAESPVTADADFSLDGSESFDSDMLEDFGSIISLPPETLASLILSHQMDRDDAENSTLGTNTVVSSAPSGSMIPAPQAAQDAWAVSPHPNMLSNTVQELSTNCTDSISYQRLFDSAASVSTRASLSTRESRLLSSSEQDSDEAMIQESRHDRVVFEAIAGQLLRDTRTDPNTGVWYSRFTDFDWKQLREVAKVVLATAGETSKLIPIPPEVPLLPESISNHSPEEYNASSIVPSNFVCRVCSEVLVGAVGLNCGCHMCSGCWEGDSRPSESDNPDYVLVDREKCPCCNKEVASPFYCHALDVAISHIVQNLDTRDSNSSRSLQMNYVSRLEAWRHIVAERNALATVETSMKQDAMIARMIQEEEEVLWGQRAAVVPQASRWLRLIGQTAVAVIAAALASLAVKGVRRR